MVRGLKTFITKEITNLQTMVSIEEKIQEWKCVNKGSSPIIVIDFPGFYRGMCESEQNQLDLFFGYHESSLDITESVFRRFKEMGVVLEIFYGSASKYAKNPELFCQRKRKYLLHAHKLVDLIKAESNPNDILRNLGDPIYSNASCFLAAIMLAEKYGFNLHKSYRNECERDIALFAANHNAMAIISCDYEFTLVNGNFRKANGQWNFWDLKYFNPVSFEILQIEKTNIQTDLKLSVDELAIFGVLTKDNFPYSLGLKFFKRLGHPKDRFKNVINFIKKRSNPKTVTPDEIAYLLSPRGNNKSQRKIVQIATENLNFFANIDDPVQIYEDELSIALKSIHNSYVYEYLNDLYVPVQTSYWRKSSYPKFIDYSIIIIRRQMGVILQHKFSEQRRSILCIDEDDIIFKIVRPEYPQLEVPFLLRLYDKTAEKSLLETKLKLLCWIISHQLNYKTIENIPKQYLCAVLTLGFLVEYLFISSEDADCILYCLQEYDLNPESMHSLKHPNTIDKKPFELIFLYDKFYQLMAISMNTVGLFELLVCNQLNGIYFHSKYEEFIDQNKHKQITIEGENRSVVNIKQLLPGDQHFIPSWNFV